MSTTLMAGGIVASSFLACGAPRLPGPTYTKHPTSALVSVPYPPPPARIEVVPEQPKDDSAIWLDGEWVWQTRRYAWKPGRWLVPPKDAKFAPWTTVRDETGTLYIASGVWRNDKGDEVIEPAALIAGRPRAAAIVSPEGDEVPMGPIISHDAGVSGRFEDRDAALHEAIRELDASSRAQKDEPASSIGDMDASAAGPAIDAALASDSGTADAAVK